MSKTIHFALAALCICAAMTGAARGQTQESAKAERVQRLVTALSLDSMLAQTQAQAAEAAKKQVSLSMGELKNMNIPPDVLERLSDMAERIAVSATQSWEPRVAARIYAEGIAEALSDDELKAAEDFYGSSIGKKSHSAITASQARMAAYIQGRTNEAMQLGMAGFVATLQEMMKQRQAAAAQRSKP